MMDLAETEKRGVDMRGIQLKKSNLIYELSQLEEELHETELYKKIEQLKKEIKIYDDLEENIKGQILDWMVESGTDRLEFEHQKMTAKANPPAVKIIDEDAIPEEYKEREVVIKIDKKKIRDAIKNGGIVDGAELIVGHSLVITPK